MINILKYFRIFQGKPTAPRKQHELVVLLVDMQREFVKALRDGEARRIIPNQLAVIRDCYENNIPIIVLEYKGYGRTIRTLRKEVRKNPSARFITKRFNDGFIATSLKLELQSLGAKKLFFMGINADCCVKQTANCAIYMKYEIVTSNDVIAGQEEDSLDNSIPWYKENGSCIDSFAVLAQTV